MYPNEMPKSYLEIVVRIIIRGIVLLLGGNFLRSLAFVAVNHIHLDKRVREREERLESGKKSFLCIGPHPH
jgi:hypothetical protein